MPHLIISRRKPIPSRNASRIRTIRIDHDLALVWAPYTVLIDGRVDHCGTNLFSLVRDGDTWMIASIADNNRKAC